MEASFSTYVSSLSLEEKSRRLDFKNRKCVQIWTAWDGGRSRSGVAWLAGARVWRFIWKVRLLKGWPVFPDCIVLGVIRGCD